MSITHIVLLALIMRLASETFHSDTLEGVKLLNFLGRALRKGIQLASNSGGQTKIPKKTITPPTFMRQPLKATGQRTDKIDPQHKSARIV